jgi:four helix bundle protein
VCISIAVHDRNLADQLRRSAQSVALNLGEDMAASGGVRRNAYATALREARECVVAIDVARRWCLAGEVAAGTMDRLDKVVATLWRLVMPAR